MRQKTRRPAARDGANRAAGSENFSKSISNLETNTPSSPKQENISPLAIEAHIFVSRCGHVGLWIPCCPFCGYEHTHGGYPVHDIRIAFTAQEGWRVPHCGQASPDAYSAAGEYQLKPALTPARSAPGAEHSRAAKRTMEYLHSLGIKTSNEMLPSAWPLSRWRWC